MAKNSMMTPSLMASDRGKDINFNKDGKPKLNATNQPPPKKKPLPVNPRLASSWIPKRPNLPKFKRAKWTPPR